MPEVIVWAQKNKTNKKRIAHRRTAIASFSGTEDVKLLGGALTHQAAPLWPEADTPLSLANYNKTVINGELRYISKDF